MGVGSGIVYFLLISYCTVTINVVPCFSLSKDGRVIIMSIHQPRYSIFRLFDQLTLLSRGVVVYTGAGRATLPYFANNLSELLYTQYTEVCTTLIHWSGRHTLKSLQPHAQTPCICIIAFDMYICKGIVCLYSHCVSILSGMECDAFDNPADFFLDRLNEAENDLRPADPESKYLHV